MSATHAPLRTPDLGPPKTLHDARVPGGTLINMAGMLALAKRIDTPKARLFHDAFSLAYERVAALPMTDGAKQQAALAEALKVCGHPGVTFLEADTVAGFTAS